MHKPNAPRYFGPFKNVDCETPIAKWGTKRKDNLERHIREQHAGRSAPSNGTNNTIIAAPIPGKATMKSAAKVLEDIILPSIEEPPAEPANGLPTEEPARSKPIHKRKRRRVTLIGSEESKASTLPPSPRRAKCIGFEHPDSTGHPGSGYTSALPNSNRYSKGRDGELRYDGQLYYGIHAHGLPTLPVLRQPVYSTYDTFVPHTAASNFLPDHWTSAVAWPKSSYHLHAAEICQAGRDSAATLLSAAHNTGQAFGALTQSS
jgi:hypothetical protein